MFKDNNLFIPIGIFTAMFILSLITFGAVVIYDLSTLETEVFQIFVTNASDYNFPNISHIFSLVRKLYVIVTTTLVVFLIAWIYLWFYEKPSTTLNRP